MRGLLPVLRRNWKWLLEKSDMILKHAEHKETKAFEDNIFQLTFLVEYEKEQPIPWYWKLQIGSKVFISNFKVGVKVKESSSGSDQWLVNFVVPHQYLMEAEKAVFFQGTPDEYEVPLTGEVTDMGNVTYQEYLLFEEMEAYE